MARFRKRPPAFEAITFDELVAPGKANCGPHFHNGMPWSFNYAGRPITHENDGLYIVCLENGQNLRMGRCDMLVTGEDDTLSVCKSDIFAATYEAVE